MQSEPEFFLYHAPGTRSGRPKMMLDLLELEYGMHTLDVANNEHKSEQYLAVHPFGLVPGLRFRGQVILESGAQVMFIADRYAQRGFSPAINSPTRARYVELFMLSTSLLEPIAMEAWRSPDSAQAKARLRMAFALLEDRLVGPFLLGATLSAADVFVHWGMRFFDPESFEGFHRLRNYVEQTNEVLAWSEY